MNLTIRGHHLDITPPLREYVLSKVDRIKRHFDHVIDISVMLTVEKLNQKDAASSGALADSVQPTELEFDGVTYTIKVQAKDYISFVDAGVNGWAVNRGSVYSFKTKGVDPNGEMVKSVKAYLKREGASARNVKVGISKRENKGMSADDRNAITAAYMIKRQGIEPKRFLSDATSEMEVIIKSEFGAAFKIDLINNLTK